jgi:modification methylase
MVKNNFELDSIIHGDCLEVLSTFPDESIDLVFADPPYNLQLNQELWRPNQTKVAAVDDDWDQFPDMNAYDKFSHAWLSECRRVLKKDAAIWVIGTYHNIYRLGKIMQDLGFWFLNDIVWIKLNPMPNFRGVRFTNAHETLIWACKEKQGKYTFNYHAMKELNDSRQMRSDWDIPICTGRERLKISGKKAHSTQKPEALLYRVVISSTNPGDIVLDPFFGTGTTGAIAKKMHRHWIGIEKDISYVKLAQDRIDRIFSTEFDASVFDVRDKKRNRSRVPFGKLLETGMLNAGDYLYLNGEKDIKAVIKPDGNLIINDFTGSIHKAARFLNGGKPSNGWEQWYYETDHGDIKKIDNLRSKFASLHESTD